MAVLHLKVENRGVCSEFPHEASTELRAAGDEDATVILRSRIGERERRRFRLQWERATPGQKYEVESLFKAAGTTQKMNYVPPNETAIVEVRFLENTLQIVQIAVDVYQMAFEVEEVLR